MKFGGGACSLYPLASRKALTSSSEWMASLKLIPRGSLHCWTSINSFISVHSVIIVLFSFGANHVKNWQWVWQKFIITVRYTKVFLSRKAFGIDLLPVIRNSWVSVVGVPNVRKSMEKQLGPESLSVISQASAVKGCRLSGVPLYCT